MAHNTSSRLIININDLLSVHRVEKQRVEFKESWNSAHTSWQVLRSICAFANDFLNDDGGYIILGVRDAPSKDGKAQVEGVPAGELDKIQKQITKMCQQGCIKPAYNPIISPEVYENKHVLVIWATASDNGPHQCRKSANGEFGYFIRKGPQTMTASPEEKTLLLQLHNKIPFDDRMAVDLGKGKQLTEGDIDSSLVKAFLREVDSKIQDQDLDNPRQLYENMRLVRNLGDKHEGGRLAKLLVPRNVALLFFNRSPEEYFQGAKAEITIYTQDVEVIDDHKPKGPIDRQINDTLDYILSKNKPKHEEEESISFVPYPRKALREAVVNAFYHRGYEPEHADPVKIRIFPSHIDITSYPGPHRSLKPEHFSEHGEMPPVKTRNRRVGEFLMQRKLAEDKGTGIRTIFRSMKGNGNFTPAFEFDESYFRVRLPGHPKFMVYDVLKRVNELCAVGEKRQAREQLLTFLRKNPEIRHNSLFAKLMELHDHNKNHPSVQEYKEHISERLERRLQLTSELQKWSSARPLDVSTGVDIIQFLVHEGADSVDLRLAIGIAVDLTNERYENTSMAGRERGLQANQNAHKLFQAMGEVTKSDAYVAFHFARCKFNLYKLNTTGMGPRERKELAFYLTKAEECVNDALCLTSEENAKNLAQQFRLLGFIHSQLLGIKKSTVKDVIDYYDKARHYNPDIHINKFLIPQDFRTRYKKLS